MFGFVALYVTCVLLPRRVYRTPCRICLRLFRSIWCNCPKMETRLWFQIWLYRIQYERKILLVI